jgi:hypothetical protein
MSDELRDLLRNESHVETPPSDLHEVTRAGRRRKMGRVAGTAVFCAAVLVGAVMGVALFLGERAIETVEHPPRDTLPAVGSEKDQAEVFALHALRDAGVFSIVGTSYFLDGSAPTEDGWRVSFNRFRCVVGDVETCYRHGEQGPGDPRGADRRPHSSDSWLHVGLNGSVWGVLRVEGNFESDVTHRLLGYEAELEPGAPGWEAATVHLSDSRDGERQAVRILMLWVGQIPYEIGSSCTPIAYGPEGQVVGRGEIFYQPGPSVGHTRGGGIVGQALELEVEAASVEVLCEPVAPGVWHVVGEPQARRRPAGVEVEVLLRWVGPMSSIEIVPCAVEVFASDGRSLLQYNSDVLPPGHISSDRSLWEGVVERRASLYAPEQIDEKPHSATVTCPG